MAVDMYLTIPQLTADPGGPTLPAPFAANAIEVLSYSIGVSTTVAFPGPTPVAGKASFANLSMMTRTGFSSIHLFGMLAAGTRIKKMSLQLVESGATFAFLAYTFGSVLIDSQQQSASSETPVESTSYAYGQILETHTAADGRGGPGQKITRGWDLINNVPITAI